RTDGFNRFGQLRAGKQRPINAYVSRYRFRSTEEVNHQIEDVCSKGHHVFAATTMIALTPALNSKWQPDFTRLDKPLHRHETQPVTARMRHRYFSIIFFDDSYNFIRFVQKSG